MQQIEKITQNVEILDKFYQQLIQITLKENKKTGIDLDYSKLYYSTNIPFKEDRIFNIRWIKIPTLKKQNKQYYYAVFINDIDFWRMGEKTELYNQIIETIDRYDIDSYTIFQFGRYHGHNDPLINNLMKYYHMYVFNTEEPSYDNFDTIYKFITDFLKKRINTIRSKKIIFGEMDKELKRLENFTNFLANRNSLNIIRIYKKNSSNISYNILKNSRRGGF